MKKIVCGLVGVIAAVNSASALTTEEIRQRCMNADNRVWDAKNQKCISKTPCKDSAYSSYCNTFFKDTQVEEIWRAMDLVKDYLEKQGLTCTAYDASDPGVVGQDYIRCHLSDGGYIEFEFDDLNESDHHTASRSVHKAFCRIAGGHPADLSEEDKAILRSENLGDEYPVGVVCHDISESVCREYFGGEECTYSKTGNFCVPYYF